MRKSLFAGLLLVIACGELEDKPFNNPPIILSVRVPSYVTSNDTLEVSTFDPEHDTVSVKLTVGTSSGQTLTNVMSRAFSDSGLYGDKTAFDGVFTGQLNSLLLLGNGSSTFEFVFEVAQQSGESSTLKISVLQNPASGHPPVLTSLSAPDTVRASQDSTFKISVTVSDPEGLNDIASVTRINVTLGGQPRSLNDDGENGDDTPADGIYSELVSVSPPPANGSYLFRVQATDKLGLKSNALEKTIVIAN